MKKIFSITSAVIFVLIVILLSVMGGVKKNIGIDVGSPDFINIYNRSTTVTNGGQAYEPDDEEYEEILREFKKITNLSLIQLAQNNNNLNYKLTYDKESYATYDSSMKNSNIVVEFMYRYQRDVVVYDEQEARVMPYICLLIIIPINNKFQDMVVYSSLSNDSTIKEEQYRTSTPFVMRGIAKNFIKFVDNLK